MTKTETVTVTEKVRDPGKKLPLMEMFGPTIQGEGAIAGQITYFLRLGACSYRCTWCDQMESVDPESIHKNATWLTQDEIVTRLNKLSRHSVKGTWLTISGGDPLSHDLSHIVMSFQADEWLKIAVETQGAIFQEWIKYLDLVTVSPKPPSSGMADRINYDTLDRYLALVQKRMIFKIVIFNAADAEFAEEVHFKYPQVPLYLSAGTPQLLPERHIKELHEAVLDSYRNLAHIVLKRPSLHSAILLPQLHVLLNVR
jgi:7-carboxy-7-deazaguanine synthase